MWLPLVLLALMASGSACPDSCECHQTTDDNIGKDVYAPYVPLDVRCRGRVPGLTDIPAGVISLSLDSAEAEEPDALLDELETADLAANGFGMTIVGASDVIRTNDTSETTNDTSSGGPSTDETPMPYLVDLAVTNCSLTSLNASWRGLERLRSLNLSRNNLSRVRDVLVIRATNLTRLSSLDLSGNSLARIGAGSFGTLAALVTLNLRRNAIATVDENAFRALDRLEFLDLSDNRLADLPDSALTPLYSLQKLDLSGNQLQVLGARWFESLDRLRELDVSRNGLARAASGTLQPLPGLSVLRLAENPLKERDVSLLLGTGRRLETVDASRTGLARVPAALTRSVRALRLAGNRLTTIRGGDLDSYPLLRMLDLADNRLTDIENDALGRLEVLEELDLSGNCLSRVPGSLPSGLTVLKLQRNAIAALQLDDLNGLYNLRSLMLNDNNISEIEVGALGQLPRLAELDLSDNPIKALSTNTLSGPVNLARLRMSGLTSLQRHQEEQSDMAFPVPTPERLIALDVSRSPVLAGQLLADDAALSACKSLIELDLSATGISTVRSDLAYMLPQLRVLRLAGNNWNCTEDLYWLGEWIRQHRGGELNRQYRDRSAPRCTSPRRLAGLRLHELPSPPSSTPTTTASVIPSAMTARIVSVTRSAVSTSSLRRTTHQPSIAPTTSFDIEAANVVSDYVTATTPSTTTAATFAKTESKTRNINDALPAVASSPSSPSTTTPRPRKKPRIYEAPTSFRNVTSSITTRASSREPSRRSGDKTNRLPMDQNLINKQTIAPPSDPELSITGDAAPQTFDNRAARRNASELSSEIVSSASTSEEKRTTDEPDAARINDTRTRSGKNTFDDRGSKTIAEELNSGRATASGARVSEALSAGAHPGMLVLVGAALSAVAALTVVLSRRARTVHRTDRYHRHENIEVHTLTPTTELW